MNTNELPVTIYQRVRAFVAENYQYREGASDLAETDSFMEHGIIDSIGILELINFLESTFEFKVADEEVVPANLDSITKVGEYVRRKLNARFGGSHAS